MTMPYAINIENINALCSRKDFGLSSGGFVFLFVFSLQSAFERKNPLAVISAFKKAFRGVSRDKVCLALKISGAAQHRWAYDEINKASAGLPVTIIDAHLDAATLYRLMDLSDCYVSLHRSEGFGLTIAESMFLGKPCIATAYSGNMEFMNADNSYPVNYSLSKIAHSIGPYKKGNLWAEPDIEHAAELMRFVYEQRDEAAQKGSSGARHMREKFSPQALSQVFERRLQAIRNGPSRNKP
jgi:glycosyltransferase involved in cell wall biosynthesis